MKRTTSSPVTPESAGAIRHGLLRAPSRSLVRPSRNSSIAFWASSSERIEVVIQPESGRTWCGWARPSAISSSRTRRGNGRSAIRSPWRWPSSRRPTLNSMPPNRCGADSTPGHDCTASVICFPSSAVSPTTRTAAPRSPDVIGPSTLVACPSAGSFDVVIAGGGHNALVAATLLARAGRSVVVLERRDEVGGAAVSVGAVSRVRRAAVPLLLPGEPVPGGAAARARRVGRDPSPPGRCLTRRSSWPAAFTSDALERLRTRLPHAHRAAPLARGVPTASSATTPPGTALFETPLSELIERTFDDDLTRGTVLTDALIGTFAPADDAACCARTGASCTTSSAAPGTCRSAAWARCRARLPARRARAGAQLVTGAEVIAIETDEEHGRGDAAPTVAPTPRATCSPASPRPCSANCWASRPSAPEGAQLKINMLLKRLPRVPGVSSEEAFTGTFHVNEGYEQLARRLPRGVRGRHPVDAAVRGLLPLADRPEHPR